MLPAEGTLVQYQWVASRFNQLNRQWRVSWTHYLAVAGMEPARESKAEGEVGQHLFQIGSRWFDAVGPTHFGGDAVAYLRRFLPFGLHKVDVRGLPSEEAAWRLWQDLERRGLMRDVLASAIIERGRDPSDGYTAELKNYLAELRDPDSMKAQRMALANFLKALAMDRNGTTFLQIMRDYDAAHGRAPS